MRREVKGSCASRGQASPAGAPGREGPRRGPARGLFRSLPKVPAGLLTLILILALLPPSLAAAPRVQNPVLVQADKDLAARRLDPAIAAYRELLDSGTDASTRVAATLGLGQALIYRAETLSKAKNDSGASTVYDEDIALLEPLLESTRDPKTKDRIDKLLSQAYMANADANIRLKNYDKALLSLQSFSAKYPERFDQANGKVKSIFSIREQYTRLASEIRDRALSSNGGDTAIPGMIEKLRNLDPYANKDILTVLLEVQTKVRDLALLKETMTAARGRIDAGDYAGALDAYLRGFDPSSTLPALFWREFADAGYDIVEKRDAATGQVVIVDAEGKARLVVLDASGRAFKTDAEGRPVKGPNGFLPLLDGAGNPLFVPLRDFGGQRQVDGPMNIVAAVEALMVRATALARGLGGSAGKGAIFTQAFNALDAAYAAGDPAGIVEALAPAQAAFADLDADRLALARVDADLGALFSALPALHPDGRSHSQLDYSYAVYAGFFLRGRQWVGDYATRDPRTDPLWRPESERGKAEGLAGTYFTLQSSAIEKAQATLQPLLDGLWANSLAAWERGSWGEAKASFDRINALIPPIKSTLEFFRKLAAGGTSAGPMPEDLNRLASKDADLAFLDEYDSLASSSSRLATARQALASLRARTGAEVTALAAGDPPGAAHDGALAAVASLRTDLQAQARAIAAEAGLEAGFSRLSARSTASFASSKRPSEGPGRELEAWRARVAASVAEARSSEVVLVALGTSLEVERLESELAARSASVAAATALTAGSPSPIAARKGLVDPYPSKSSVVLAEEEAKVNLLTGSARDLGTRLQAEADWIRNDPAITPLAARDQTVARAGAELQTRRAAALAEALAKKKTGAQAMDAANKSFTQAETLLATANAELPSLVRRPAARAALEDATTAREAGYSRFLDAMAADFDPPTWEATLARYNAIGRGVNGARDQYARLEVDRLLADAQHSYDLANFDASYDSLSKANTLWKERYPAQTYPPLAYWLKLVSDARDAGNTRVIRQNDPLYREMTQYLSLARISYDNGVASQRAGRMPEAKKLFAEASSYIANVTRTFPLNADAGFLSLQILKATSEADFRSSLPNRLTAISDLLKTDPAQAYARIADLARIEPNDDRVARLLVRAEVATGRRKAEPTSAEKARSAVLTDQARQLMKTGRQADLNLAAQRLDEALALDRNNRDAQTLSLNIQTLRGGGPEKTLSVEDSRRLADARLYFSQGQYNQSRDTLNALLASEATKTRDVLLLDAQLNQLNY